MLGKKLNYPRFLEMENLKRLKNRVKLPSFSKDGIDQIGGKKNEKGKVFPIAALALIGAPITSGLLGKNF